MADAPPPRALLRTLGLGLVVGLVVLAVTRHVPPRFRDNDELWHLACGRWIVESGGVPATDPFTWSAGDTPWISTNWLAQVVLWGLYRAGGFGLVCALGAALHAAAVGVTLAVARRRATSPWAALAPVLWVTLALGTASTVRPQGFTFALLGAALLLVERLRDRPTRGRALALGALLALALQLHGGYVFVFAAVGLSAVGEACDLAAGRPGARRRTAWLLVAAVLLGVAAAGLHPQGLEVLRHPLRYGLDPRLQAMNREVTELMPPDLTGGIGRLIEVPLVALLGLALLGRPRLRMADVLLLLAFAHLALTSARGLHVLVVAVAGPAAAIVDAALVAGARGPALLRARLRALEALAPGAELCARWLPVALLVVAPAAVLVASAGTLGPGRPGELTSPVLTGKEDAVAMAELLRDRPLPGRLWNEQEEGGLLLWALPPGTVSFDGRGDLHARADTWAMQSIVVCALPGWAELLDGWGCDLALVKTRYIRDGLTARGWRAAVRKGELTLFVRPGSAADRAL